MVTPFCNEGERPDEKKICKLPSELISGCIEGYHGICV